jgi:hypothetical protein
VSELSLLCLKARMVSATTDALKQVSSAVATSATAATQPIKTLAKFAADVADTFRERVSRLYSGISGQRCWPMLLGGVTGRWLGRGQTKLRCFVVCASPGRSIPSDGRKRW